MMIQENTVALHDLPGISQRIVEAVFVENADEVREKIHRYKYLTAAGKNGAFNLYIDDMGCYRCIATQWCRDVEKQTYSTIEEAIKWASEKFKWISGQ